jgi:LysR family glycine cleavage system transcriptional activator
MLNPTRSLPPLDLLRGFESAARHLSFTRAAAELFLTQSAVSRQIQALEEFVGVPLFERRHKALTLTEDGQAYYRTVAAALEQVRDATRKLRDAKRGHVLTVTTTVSFASAWLVPRLARFRRENPGIDVRITATHEVVDLERQQVDLAVRDCAVADAPPGAIHLVGEHMAAVCSPEYAREAKAQKKPLTRPEDLSHHVLINLHDPSGRWPWLSWAQWLEAAGIQDFTPAATLSFDQYDQVITAVLHGQGIALGRMSITEQYRRDKRLTLLFGRRQCLERGYYLVFAKGAAERPEVKRFTAWMRSEVAPAAAEAAATAA